MSGKTGAAEFTIDAEEVRRMFAELSPRNRKNAFKRAIRGGLVIVKKHTISNLKHAISPQMIGKTDKYGNSFRKGIKTKAYKDGNSGVIHILGNYKLKFFEMGTQARYNKTVRGKHLKKQRYTGRIPAYHFFKAAKRESEREVFNSIDRLLSQSIQKINNKFK